MLTRDDLIARVHTAIQEAGSQKNLAQQWGISPGYITDLLHGLREPGPKILRAMDIERIVLYRLREQGHDKD